MQGTVLALGVAGRHGDRPEPREAVTLIAGHGIEGDRYAGTTRQVTIVCTGELEAAAAELGLDRLDGVSTRRNIVVDLPALPRSQGAGIAIGETRLEVWRDCAPCEVMDATFGAGARRAMHRRAGVSATVLTDGVVRVGDAVLLGD